MKLLLSFLFLCLVCARPVLGQTDTYHCEFSAQQGPRAVTLYSSDVFHAAQAENPAIGVDNTSWTNGFDQFLAEKSATRAVASDATSCMRTARGRFSRIV